jgi:hypothetical protein
VGFGFFGSTKQYFGVPDETMSGCKIGLQRQCLLGASRRKSAPMRWKKSRVGVVFSWAASPALRQQMC